jgi:hypothetical protein
MRRVVAAGAGALVAGSLAGVAIVMAIGVTPAAAAPVTTVRPAQVVLPPLPLPLPPLPPIVLPPIDLPPITLPPIDVPPIVIPGLPPVDLPPITLPPVDAPPVGLPSVALPPAATTPGATPGAPGSTPPGTSVGVPTLGAVLDALGDRAVPIARDVLVPLVTAARGSLRELAAAGVAPELLAPLQHLVDQILDRAGAITEPLVRELVDLLARVRAVLPPALQDLLDPIQDLVDGLIDTVADAVVPLPTLPGTKPRDRDGTTRPRDGAGSSDRANADGRDGNATGASERTRSRTGRAPGPYDHVPVGPDTALLGGTLNVPAPIPSPTRDDLPPAVVVPPPGAGSGQSDRSSHEAVIPGNSSTELPVAARAPPSSARLIRVLVRGPESRPG